MRRLLSFLCLFGCGLAPQAFREAPAPVPAGIEPPDVVMLVLDDVAREDLEEANTPFLDQLAAEGRVFRHGKSQPICAPSRFSIMLGEWRFGRAGSTCVPDPRNVSEDRYSLPRLADDAGYTSVHLGRWAVGGTLEAQAEGVPYYLSAYRWGFDHQRATFYDGVESACTPNGTFLDWQRVDDGPTPGTATVAQSSQWTSDAIAEAFVGWWVERRAGPRLALVNFGMAHKPWIYPPAYAMRPGYVAPPIQIDREKYLDMIEAADWAVERMLADVDPETTLVLLVGDNGTPRGVTPLGVPLSHAKGSIFERGIGVPFVAWGAGVVPGESDDPVSIVDFMATLADLSGTPLPSSVDGDSFVPALSGQPLERPWIFAEQQEQAIVAKLRSGPHAGEVWKLRHVTANGNQWLYDLANDPDELAAIPADDLVEVSDELRGYLDEALGK